MNKEWAEARDYYKKSHFNYKATDGRIYAPEKPLYYAPLTTLDKADIRNKETMSAELLYNCIVFLSAMESGHPEKFVYGKQRLKNDERATLVEEYQLWKDEKDRLYKGDPDYIFRKLCDRFECAKKFKKFKEIHYAVRYGYNPIIKVYKEEKD